MSEKEKADLDRLDTLRDLALCGPEENREEYQRDYEELRSRLLAHDECNACDDDVDTKELTMKGKDRGAAKQPGTGKDKKQEWDSNKDQQNPRNLPWPKENEAKD